jgi:hypothetical protein
MRAVEGHPSLLSIIMRGERRENSGGGNRAAGF